MLKNITVTARISMGFAFMLLVLLLIVGSSLLALGRAGGSLDDLVNRSLAFSHHIQSVRAEVGNLRRYEKDLLLNIQSVEKRKEYLDKWQDSAEKVRLHLQSADALASTAEQEAIKSLLGAMARYESGLKSVASQIEAGGLATPQEGNKALEPVKDAVRGMESTTRSLVENASAQAVASQQGVQAEIVSSRSLLLALSALALLAGMGAAVAISLSIRRPLGEMTLLAEQLASSKDLSVAIPDYGRNELGRTGQALNHLIVTVRELISESHQHSAKLVGASDRLSGVSHAIHDAAVNQSNAASASAAAVEQLTVSVSVLADNAEGVELQSRQTATDARAGSDMAQTAASQIQHIAQSIAQTSGTIDSLNQRSSEIGNIVSVIREIADQTNLLALNAAIEAARAGETGRGFAVVADEVRKLAERTSQATTEISSRIAGVQHDTQQAFQNMQQANTLVESGVEGTGKVAQSLQQIFQSSIQAQEKVAEMVQAIQEQRMASQDIAQNMEQIAQMNDQTRLAVAEATSLSGGLKQQSQELDRSITRFKV
ncbi:methyl-accepting chemotaxis protein [Vogesella mureinivorans]|uniref:methyl-accepting chemotaxis protein n=1 Tax=Vogesella mureinivorans TaxID=657276 RepID=UPI0014785C80|nr:HAMP domain-containing methyl-accepting chemotaxis protein [Vogesella mureinivorans]